MRQEGQQHLVNGLWNVLVELGDVIDIEFSCDESHAKVWSLSLVAQLIHPKYVKTPSDPPSWGHFITLTDSS